MRGGGHDRIAHILQFGYTFRGGPISIHIHPLLGTHGNVFVQTLSKSVLDNMYFLNSEGIATSKDGARVMQLKHIFNGHGEEFGAIFKDFQKTLLALFGQKGFQIRQQIVVQHKNQDRENWNL